MAIKKAVIRLSLPASVSICTILTTKIETEEKYYVKNQSTGLLPVLFIGLLYRSVGRAGSVFRGLRQSRERPNEECVT